MTDDEIVDFVIEGNEEAIFHLLYVRYDDDLRFYVWRYYNSLEYLEDLINELYIHLKGKHGDWQPLKSFQWRCSFRTWFCSVASHLFLKKKAELIGLEIKDESIEVESKKQPMFEDQLGANNDRLVILMEAINRLKNTDYRFILIKELEGYNHEEIAKMLALKRKKDKKETFYRGKLVVPNAHYVDMNKAKALKEVKLIVEQIKVEWYGNK